MTPEMVEKYLKEPHKCPYCGHDQLEGGSLDLEDNMVFQDIQCLECNMKWEDHYKLIDAEEKAVQ